MERKQFYDEGLAVGWNEQDGPFWQGRGDSVENRLYRLIEAMADDRATLAHWKQRAETARAEALDAALNQLLPMIPVSAEKDARRLIAALRQSESGDRT